MVVRVHSQQSSTIPQICFELTQRWSWHVGHGFTGLTEHELVKAALQLLCCGVQHSWGKLSLDLFSQFNGGTPYPIHRHPIQLFDFVEAAQDHTVSNEPIALVQAHTVRRSFSRQQGVSENDVVAMHHLGLSNKRFLEFPRSTV